MMRRYERGMSLETSVEDGLSEDDWRSLVKERHAAV